MARTRPLPEDPRVFAGLPVHHVTVGRHDEQIAVHVAGGLAPGRVPVVVVPGYNRNMLDHADMARVLRQMLGPELPVVLVDLRGRGRSSDRRRAADYSTLADATDVDEVARALAIERAIFVGQGHGGQVLMALAARRPNLIAGTVLVDSGPVSDPRGLVRLRATLAELRGVRGESGLKTMLRRMVAADYPAIEADALDRLAQRTHSIDGRGRLLPLFDPALVKLLERFEVDDVLVAQWQLYGALGSAPLLLLRTQLTQQLRRETFEEMMKRRRDAEAFVIEQQGSPALLDTPRDLQPIADFVRDVSSGKRAA